MFNHSVCEIVEKSVPSLTIATIKWKGEYSKTGEHLKKLGMLAGRRISGFAMNLYHDLEYMADDSSVETCFPISGRVDVEGVSVRTLVGGRCISLIHEGSYQELDEAYKHIMEHVARNNLKVLLPTREIFIEGPGMLLKRDPKSYITELQFFIG